MGTHRASSTSVSSVSAAGMLRSSSAGVKASAQCHRVVAPETTSDRVIQWKYIKYEVGIEQCEGFNLMRRLLVPGGGEIKKIAKSTGAKLTVRGKGSGHLEEQKEVSDEPLVIWISSAYPENLAGARVEVEELIAVLHEEYRAFCVKRALPTPELTVSTGTFSRSPP